MLVESLLDPVGVARNRPADLEGDQRLASTCCHREQNAFLTLEDSLQSFIDGDLLIVARDFIADIGWGEEFCS
jgi:hypothetical protein